MSSSAYVSLCLAISPPCIPLDTLICRHVFLSAALLASRHRSPWSNHVFVTHTTTPMPFITLLPASLAFAYNYSCMPCTLSIISLFSRLLSFCSLCLFVVFIVSVIYHFAIYIQLAASWSVFYFVGLNIQGPPSPPYPFQSNFRLAGTIFVSHFCSGAFPPLLFSS
ncbi:hypothetical protein BKA82DRAFT_4073672 [Pisolithus tinctorius]|nr:hypothetical protein BKA82DRAFT_4073672 [Pisolithus tinctorius]